MLTLSKKPSILFIKKCKWHIYENNLIGATADGSSVSFGCYRGMLTQLAKSFYRHNFYLLKNSGPLKASLKQACEALGITYNLPNVTVHDLLITGNVVSQNWFIYSLLSLQHTKMLQLRHQMPKQEQRYRAYSKSLLMYVSYYKLKHF